jgi:Uma2 family endonuclease
MRRRSFGTGCACLVPVKQRAARNVDDVHLRFFSRAEHPMGMPAAAKRWTAAEVRALIQANPLQTPRYELIDGELLVTSSPNYDHQRAVAQLLLILGNYVRLGAIGEAATSPFDIELESESVVQPDLFVIPPLPTPRPRRLRTLNQLLLSVEIISPSSARYDRVRKRAYYARNQVPEYWVIDLDARVFERSRPGENRPEVLAETLTWHPAGAHEPLVIDVAAYFADVLGDAPDRS